MDANGCRIKSIGQNIKEVRKQKGMSQEELSKSSGVSQVYISQIECEKKSPTIRTLEKISSGLGVVLSVSLQ